MKVETEADLAKLRRWAAPRLHDDERLADTTVTLLRGYRPLGSIQCATSDLSWTAYRLVAGIRYRRESEEAWRASELAALDVDMALAA